MAQPSEAGPSENHGKRNCDLDTHSLDCQFCFEPLSIPVHQCQNGHSSCSACCEKFAKGCPICGKPLSTNRNAALEKIIECLQIDCKHASHGCTTKLRFIDRNEIEEHENKVCEYRPLLCPFQTRRLCLHIGPGVTIPHHLQEVHGVQIEEPRLGHGESHCFRMKATCPMTLLKTERAWLIVNCFHSLHDFGSFLYCTAIGSSKVTVPYRLSLERVMLGNEEKKYYTFTAVQAIAPSYRKIDLHSLTMDSILMGAYLNVPHMPNDQAELEFDLKLTVLAYPW